MRKTLILLMVFVLCAGMLFANGSAEKPASSADVKWPTGDVVLVVPYKAGGDTDLYCRAIAEALTKLTGCNFVVTNVTGAGAMNAAVDVLEGLSDGSKFLFGHNTYLAYTASGKAAVDVTKELKAAAGIVADTSLCLYATKASGITCMQDAIDQAKAGKQVRISTVANTYPNYCIRQLLDKANATDLIRTVETGSTVGEQAIAALAGQCEIVQGQFVAVEQFVQSGDLVPIGCFADELTEGMHDVTTFKSQGFDVVEPKEYMFWAHPEMDDAIVAKFADAIKQISDDEGLKKVLSSYYAGIGYLTPAEMQEYEDRTVEGMKKYFGN